EHKTLSISWSHYRSPEIKNKYPAAICLALGFFLSIVISVMFCLVKKMVEEYQQNSGQ
ncbi:TPA: hypothetical protein ACOM5L_004898, partial [Escherichia coli]